MFLNSHADVQKEMYKCLFGSEESKAEAIKALPETAKKFLTQLE
jgi:hypothetical protein